MHASEKLPCWDNHAVVVGRDAGSFICVFAAVTAAAGLSLIPRSARAAAPRGNPHVVLGCENSFVPGGYGWGTARPSRVYNGGDPNGMVWKIQWRNWSGKVATGNGLTWVFRPQGGYYRAPGRIELRASHLGRYHARGALAYLHLEAREAPGATTRFGPWFAWNGRSNLCRASS